MSVLLLDLFVPGIPRPKGSLTPQQVRDGAGQRTGRVRLVDSDLSKRWRRTMAAAARDQVELRQVRSPRTGVTYVGPVVVVARFGFARCCAERIHDEPHVGDLDKLLRNVYDALQDAQVYGNDRQVVRDGGSLKTWADPSFQGVALQVWGDP